MQHRSLAPRGRRAVGAGVLCLALAVSTLLPVSEPAPVGEPVPEGFEEREVLSIGVIAGPQGALQVVLPGENITRGLGSNAAESEAARAPREWLEPGIITGGATQHDMAAEALIAL